MVGGDALPDAAELQPHDLAHHLVGQRVVRDRHQPPEQRRREHLQQRRTQGLGDGLRLGHQVRVAAQTHDQVAADVAGQQDDGVAEVDVAPFPILHPALVEDLEEEFVHVRVRLLDLVQQHHAVRPPPHRLGQHTAFAIPDITRGRALERGDGVRLLELAHVDGDDVLLAAVERLGQRQRRLGLAHARGAGEQEDADRLVRVVEPGARGLDAPGDHLQRVFLADHPLVERVGQLQHRLHLVLDHAPDGDAGPVLHHRRHRLLVHGRQDQRRVALVRGEFGLQRLQLGQRIGALAVGQRRGWVGLCVTGLRAQLGPQRQQAVDQRLLVVEPGLQFGLPRLLGRNRRLDPRLPVRDHHADRRLALDQATLHRQRLQPPLAVLQGGRRRVQAHRHPRTRRVQQAHRLVRQLPRRDVAVRQPDRRLDRLVEQHDAVVFLQHGRHAAQHVDRLGLVRLGHLHDLEAPGQRRILLDVLLVLGPGGRGDGAQLAAGQGGLEQVGRVARARCAARADQRVRLVDEQDDRLRGRLHLVDHAAQPALELALHAGTGLQQADVEHVQLHLLQLRRHVALHQPLRKPFDHRRLAHAGLAGEDRVVLAAAHQDVDDLADLLVAAGHRVQLARPRLLGQVDGVLLQRLLLAHRGRGDGVAGLARRGVRRLHRAGGFFRRAGDDLREVAAEHVGVHAVELAADLLQALEQPVRLEQAEQQVAGADLRRAELQRRVDPGALDRIRHRLGDVRDGGGAAGQAVQRGGQVRGEPAGVEAEVAQDAVQVAVLRVEQLRQPVLQLHIRIAPQLAEHERALDRLVGRGVELAEQGGAADFRHADLPWIVQVDRSGGRSRSGLTSRSARSGCGPRRPSQVLRPSRVRWPPWRVPSRSAGTSAPRSTGCTSHTSERPTNCRTHSRSASKADEPGRKRS